MVNLLCRLVNNEMLAGLQIKNRLQSSTSAATLVCQPACISQGSALLLINAGAGCPGLAGRVRQSCLFAGLTQRKDSGVSF